MSSRGAILLRRSSRLVPTKAKDYILFDRDGLQKKYIDERTGYGVFATKEFRKDDFLLVYVGVLLNAQDAEIAEKSYCQRNSKYPRCYMYYFVHDGKKMCVDATRNNGRLGRLVNDSSTPNCKMKKELLNGQPYLCLYAITDISVGEQLFYNYNAENLWWREFSDAENEMDNAPAIRYDDKLGKPLSINCGASIHLEVEVSGCPTPSITWYHMDKVLEDSAEVTIKTSEEEIFSNEAVSYLKIKAATIKNEGNYKVMAQNEAGKASVTFAVVVKNTPSVPRNIRPIEVSSDFIVFAWDPPEADGGAPIISYTLEKKDSTRPGFCCLTKVEGNITQYKATRLFEGSEYYFRVIAENMVGQSEAGVTETPIKLELPCGVDICIVSENETVQTAEEKGGGESYLEQLSSDCTVEMQVQKTTGKNTILHPLTDDAPSDDDLAMEIDALFPGKGNIAHSAAIDEDSIVPGSVTSEAEEETLPGLMHGNFAHSAAKDGDSILPETSKGETDFLPGVTISARPKRKSVKRYMDEGQLDDSDADPNYQTDGDASSSDNDLDDDDNPPYKLSKWGVNWGAKRGAKQRKIDVKMPEPLTQKETLNGNGNKMPEPCTQKETQNVFLQMPEPCTQEETQNEHGSKQEAGMPIQKNSAKKKPDRCCPFCKRLISGGKLKRHLQRKHKDHNEVKEMINASPSKQNHMFSKLRVQGMHDYNEIKMQEENFSQASLMRERIPKKQDSLRVCTKCNKYISSRYFYVHKTKCDEAGPLKLFELTMKEPHRDEEFQEDILNKFHDSKAGNLCRTDHVIKMVGYRHFCLRRREKSKRQEVRKCIMTEMRELAHVYLLFKKSCPESNTVEDMFTREHLSQLLGAIDERVQSDNSEKAGLKLLLNSIMQKTIKTLRGYFNSQKKDDKASELEKFLQAYNFHVPERFASARHHTLKVSMETTRKPNALPNESELKKLRSYCMTEIQHVTENFKLNLMTWLRSLLVAVITLWNFRRGEEGSRITVNEWNDAIQGEWIPKTQVEQIKDAAEKYLVGKYKLVYLHGKGEKRFVPCLIPITLVQPINLLLQHRKEYGIKEENVFLFATKGGKGHASGWQAVHEVGSKIGVKITATQNRHYISTLYAGLEMSSADREIFYSHMGHDQAINKKNYQCPHGLKEIKLMGSILEDMDKVTEDNDVSDVENASETPSIGKTPKVKSSTASRDNLSLVAQAADSSVDVEIQQLSDQATEGNDMSDMEIALPNSLSGGGTGDTMPNLPTLPPLVTEDNDVSDVENASETPSIGKTPKVKSIRWTKDDVKLLELGFPDYFTDMRGHANQGPLPAQEEILQFVEKNTLTSLKGLSKRSQYLKIRSKLFNERKARRARLHKRSKNLSYS